MLQEKLKSWGEKAKHFFSQMGKRAKAALGIAAAAVILVAVGVAVFLNNRPYTALFTGLSSAEMSSIVSYLNENGVTDYRVQGEDTILVPETQEPRLKAQLLMEGYPSSGFAYETYRAGVGSMSTESDRQMAYLQDLQDRMAGVIRCMDGVKDAVVTIAPGEDRSYVLDSGNVVGASASVMVTLSGNSALTEQEAAAIRSLVAHAVQGLEVDHIAISDSLGNDYSSGDSAVSSASSSELKLKLEAEVNNKVRTQVLSVLTPLYGAENVRVAVNSTVDISHTVGETTSYTEPAWAADGSTKGEGIIGSKVYDQEVVRGGGGTVGGVVGNESNSDISTYVESGTTVSGNETYMKNQGTTNYNVNTDKQQVERTAGTVSDLMVSVTINSAAAGGVSTGQLLTHVARAAGIGAGAEQDKISILSAPFYTQQENPVLPGTSLQLPDWAIYAAAGGVGLLLLVLILIALMRRSRRNKKRGELERMLRTMPAAASVGEGPETGADIMNIKTEKSIQLRQEIRKFAEENPEITAQMLKGWLRGDEENG